MPFSLSIGDVIAVSTLIKDSIKALDDSKGSAAECQEIIRELWSLDRAYLGVIDFVSRCSDTTFELKALCRTVEQNVKQCQQCISRFLEKIECYQKSLGGGTCSAMYQVRDAADKLKWALRQKDELAKFRTEIVGFTSAINMLLITVTMHLAKNNGDNFEGLNSKLSEAGRKADEQLTLLDRVLQILHGYSSQQESQRRVLSSLLGSFKHFYTLGGELKSIMLSIWCQCTRTYEILMDLQTRVPREFRPCWIQDPVIFTDAHDRVAPLPLELVNSWPVLEKLLAARFENIPGHGKVVRREYVLQDKCMNSDIDFSLPFDSAFRPGREICMSMVIKHNSSGYTCPVCKLESNAGLQVQTLCLGCGLSFQRVEEIIDEPVYTAQQFVGNSDTGTYKSYKAESGVINSKMAGTNDTTPEDVIGAFRRVRLLLRRVYTDFASAVIEHPSGRTAELTGNVINSNLVDDLTTSSYERCGKEVPNVRAANRPRQEGHRAKTRHIVRSMNTCLPCYLAQYKCKE